MTKRMKKRQPELTIDSGSMKIAAALIITKFIAVSIVAAFTTALK